MTPGASAQDVATWMLAELRREGMLYQDVVVYEIAERFGEQFIYDNENGNLAISKAVLNAFRKLSGNDIVWCRSERYWRPREQWDLPSRQQP
jgi:hypothetical protein